MKLDLGAEMGLTFKHFLFFLMLVTAVELKV